MTNSAFLCYKLIDDIVKRGGQEVSDRYIVKACLNRVVLSNHKLTTNQMIVQTGIKSQHATIDSQFKLQAQPKVFKKDQFMSKSVQRYKQYKKARNMAQSCQIQSNKKNKIKRNNIEEPAPENNQIKLKKKPTNNIFIQIQDKLARPKYEITAQQQKINDKMRAYLLNKQATRIKQQAQSRQQQQKKMISFRKTHNNFKKQVGSSHTQHTYDTDGKFMVYPIKNKQRYVSNNFPVTLSSQVRNQQYLSKKKHVSPEKFKIKAGSATQQSVKTIENGSQQTKIDPQSKQSNYHNNHKRQISSVNYLKAKPGICFTEPSSGASVRGEVSSKSQFQFFKLKKSCFQKFLTPDTRSQTDGFVKYKKISSQTPYSYKKKSSINCKTQYYNPSQRANILAAFSRRSKMSKQVGTIRDINQPLLDQLIDFIK